MGNFLSDWVAPIAGGLAGSYFGGPWGAAAGAAGGRFIGGLAKDEDTESNLRNSALAGGLGYGGASAYNALADNWLNGNFASMGNAPATTAAGGSGAAASGTGGLLSGGFKSPAALMGLSALANSYAASEAQKNADEIYAKQMQGWNQNAFPNAARVDAQTASAMSGINQQSMLARQKLMDQMAARGMGANSGVLAGAAAEEDRARRQRMAALANQLIQFKNTPMYAPPQYQGSASAGQTLGSNIGSAAGLLAGYGLYNGMR